jgi:hypothetical protein
MKKLHIYSVRIKKRNDDVLQIEQGCTYDNSSYFEVVTVQGQLVWEDETKFKLMVYSVFTTIDD